MGALRYTKSIKNFCLQRDFKKVALISRMPLTYRLKLFVNYLPTAQE